MRGGLVLLLPWMVGGVPGRYVALVMEGSGKPGRPAGGTADGGGGVIRAALAYGIAI